jgi:hypothetical protein
MVIILPLNIFWCSFLTVVCLPKLQNGFKTKAIYNSLSAKKNAAISNDIPQELMIRKAKLMGGTLNDVVMTVLSLSLKKYLERYTNDQKTDTI